MAYSWMKKVPNKPPVPYCEPAPIVRPAGWQQQQQQQQAAESSSNNKQLFPTRTSNSAGKQQEHTTDGLPGVTFLPPLHSRPGTTGTTSAAPPQTASTTKRPEEEGEDDEDDDNTGGEDGGERVVAETEHDKFVKEIKSKVTNDIGRLLHSSKAYVHHYIAPPVFKEATVKALAKPKHKQYHPDELLQGLDDPSDYAKWKTRQMACRRVVREERAERAWHKAQLEQFHLDNYRNYKQQQKLSQLAQEEAAKEDQACYSRQLASYLADKGRADLARYKAKAQAGRQRGLSVHEEGLAGFFTGSC